MLQSINDLMDCTVLAGGEKETPNQAGKKVFLLQRSTHQPHARLALKQRPGLLVHADEVEHTEDEWVGDLERAQRWVKRRRGY